MRFGLFGGAQARRGVSAAESIRGYDEYVAYNVEAEALGFYGSFLTEHHFTAIGQVSATLNVLTWIAAQTTTLRLGTAVLVLPWHNPVLLAEQAATLDLLSGGRLDFGVGKGYRHNEFSGFCREPDSAPALFEEALAIITKAWTSGERFSHRGDAWSFENIIVEPPPAQRPHPPFWIAAGKPESIRDCARRGYNLLLDQFASPQQTGERLALFRDSVETQGQQFDPMRVAVARNFRVCANAAETDEAMQRQAQAHQRLLDLSRGQASRDNSHILAYSDEPGAREAHSLIGTPDQIAAKLEALQEEGVRYVLLNGQGNSRENLRSFARDVMPAFVD